MIEESTYTEILQTETRSARALVGNALHALDLALARPDAIPVHVELVDCLMKLESVLERMRP